MLSLLLVILGAAMVLHGAGKLTDGAAALAVRLGVPQIVVGLTVVALGTSMPEFVVSLVSALRGTADLAVGNVVGSNIFNTTLIVGTAAVVAPMTISRSTVTKDIPFAVVATLLLTVMCLDGNISRLDAAILFVGLVVFMVYTFVVARRTGTTAEGTVVLSTGKSVLFILLGLTELVVGGNVFVSGATAIARSLHVSDAVIGLTIVAGGTSLPELATCVVAARKGHSAIAIGNVIGSNVLNILMIVGVTGLVTPLSLDGISIVDLSVMAAGMILLWFMSYTKYTVERREGVTLVALFAAYMAWLLTTV